MGILDDARAAQDGRLRGGVCGVARLKLKLSPEDFAELESAIDDPEIEYSVLSRVMIGRDVRVEPHTLSRHANRICRCRPLR